MKVVDRRSVILNLVSLRILGVTWNELEMYDIAVMMIMLYLSMQYGSIK